MRALVFSLTYDPFVGGAEIALREITERLPHISFDIITLRFDSRLPKKEDAGNVRIHRVGFTRRAPAMSDTYRFPLSFNKYVFPFFALKKAALLRLGTKYDFVWSMMASYNGFAGLLYKEAHPRTPFLLTLQEGDPLEHIKKRAQYVYPLFKRIFRRADRIQAISHFLADFGREMGHPREVAVIPNGVDTSVFAKEFPQGELDELRRTLNKRPHLGVDTHEIYEDVTLVTASRLVPKNGVAHLISALTHLPQNVKLVILGDGPDLIFLRNVTTQLGVDERVVFVGQVQYDDIAKYFRIADIFVRPSLSEGMGNAFVEAMAAGLPVIGTPVGGIVDFLFDPDHNPDREPTGIFCAPGNPESIAAAVKRLMDDAELAKRIAENGKRLALAEYDWNLIAGKMDALFKDLVAVKHR